MLQELDNPQQSMWQSSAIKLHVKVSCEIVRTIIWSSTCPSDEHFYATAWEGRNVLSALETFILHFTRGPGLVTLLHFRNSICLHTGPTFKVFGLIPLFRKEMPEICLWDHLAFCAPPYQILNVSTNPYDTQYVYVCVYFLSLLGNGSVNNFLC